MSLPAAADRFLGPAAGTGKYRRWVCPHPDHPAGDRTPSLAVSRGRDGLERWRCRTCGEHGTALDVVMLTQQRDFREALRLLDDLAEQLPERAGTEGVRSGEPPHPARARVPREVLLAHFDLRDLADELLGPGKGRGRSRTWRCPLPGHGPQTGRTPPVTVHARDGTQRWRCHACGEGGTAIDLVMAAGGLDTGAAFSLLLNRLGDRPLGSVPAVTAQATPAGLTARSREAIAAHVDRCQELLWSNLGLPGQRFLTHRGLEPPVLHANRVGYDPGPSVLPRKRGIPRRGPAVVLPVLDDDGRAVYLQARYLSPHDDRLYGNLAEAFAGPSPRVAFTRPPGPEIDPGVVVVCEGQLDALSAAQAGYAAAAVLAAGLPDERVAQALLERHPTRRLVLAFDDDQAGRNGAAKLTGLLADQRLDPGRLTALTPPHCDLNDWLRAAGTEFPHQLRRLVDTVPDLIPPESPTASDRRHTTSADYAVHVWHELPARTGEPRAGHVHVHTLAVPAGLLTEEAVMARSPERRGDLARLAAELIVDVGGYAAPDSYREPYAGLARDYHGRQLRPIGIGDVLVVAAPDGSTTSLEWTVDGVTRLPGPPLAARDLASQPSPEPPEYIVKMLYWRPQIVSYAHVYTTVVPPELTRERQDRERAAGRAGDPQSAAADVVYRAGNRDPEELGRAHARLARHQFARVDRAPSPGDVLLVTTRDGEPVALRNVPTGTGWETLGEVPRFAPLVRPRSAMTPLPEFRVQVLQPVTPHADDLAHVHTLEIPAQLVQGPDDRETVGDTALLPAVRAAEMTLVVGSADPRDLDEVLADLALDYRSAGLRPVSTGDVLLVTTPEGASSSVQRDGQGWRELGAPPPFSPSDHSSARALVTSTPGATAPTPEVRSELLADCQRVHGTPPAPPDLGPAL